MNRVFVLRSTEARKHAINFIEGLDSAQLYELVVRIHKDRRSKPQNSRYWAILGIIASDTGHSTEELHEHLKREFLGFEVVSIMGKEYERVRSTTRLDVKAFAEYCARVEAWAAVELGGQL